MKNQRHIVSSAIGTIVVQGASAGLLFLNSLVLARTLGQSGFGAYEYADAWIEVLVLFSMLGFDRLLIRLVAEHQQAEDWGRLRGIFRYALRRIIFCVALGLPIVGLIITALTANQDNSVTIITTFWIALILLPLRAMLKLNQVTLQGLRRVVFAYLPDYVIRPALLFIGVMLVVDIPQQAMAVHVLSAGVALVVSVIFLRQFMPDPVATAQRITDASWLRQAFPFMLISGMTMLNLRGGTTLVGMLTDLDTVALYSIAVRTSGIIALALTAVVAVVAPRIARLYTANQIDELQRLITWSTRGMTVMAIGVLIVFAIFGRYILGLFGADFPQAYDALMVVSLGQLVTTAVGVTGWLLMMTGHETAFLKILLISTALHYGLLIVLIPPLGLIGAAWSTASGSILSSILLAGYAWRRLKINPTFL